MMPAIADGFERFWNLYPRKQARPEAERAYEKALTLATCDRICAGVKRYIAQGLEAKYILMPAKWLEGRRWDDEATVLPMTEYRKSFPPETRSSPRPRALTFANVYVPPGVEQFAAMIERAKAPHIDPREFFYDPDGLGIWVSHRWLMDDRGDAR